MYLSSTGFTASCALDHPGGAVADVVTYRWDSGSSSDFDCTAERTLSHHSNVPNPSDPMCGNYSGLTVTVN